MDDTKWRGSLPTHELKANLQNAIKPESDLFSSVDSLLKDALKECSWFELYRYQWKIVNFLAMYYTLFVVVQYHGGHIGLKV